MALQRELETLDGVNEALAEFYVQDQGSGKFVLQVQGVVPKERLDEFRNNNNALMKERDTVKLQLEELQQAYGVSPEEVADLKKLAESMKDKKLFDDEGIESLVEKRISSLKAEKDAEIRAREKKLQELAADREHWAHKYQRTVIDRELTDAAIKAGVKPSALTDVILRGQGMWNLNDDGKIVAKDQHGDLVYGADGVSLMAPEEWMSVKLREAAPHFFEPSGGGGGVGGGGPGGSRATNVRAKSDLKTPADKAAFITKHGYDAFAKLPAVVTS